MIGGIKDVGSCSYSHRKLGLLPESLGSAIGNIADIDVLINVLFGSVSDQTQATWASHDRRASTTQYAMGHLNNYVHD